MSELNINYKCGICQDVVGKRKKKHNRVITPCKHVFHKTCFNKYLKQSTPIKNSHVKRQFNDTCPICQSPVNNLFKIIYEKEMKIISPEPIHKYTGRW